MAASREELSLGSAVSVLGTEQDRAGQGRTLGTGQEVGASLCQHEGHVARSEH